MLPSGSLNIRLRLLLSCIEAHMATFYLGTNVFSPRTLNPKAKTLGPYCTAQAGFRAKALAGYFQASCKALHPA